MSKIGLTNPSFVLEAVKKVTLRDIPVPEITDPYDVIVNINQNGICGYVSPLNANGQINAQ